MSPGSSFASAFRKALLTAAVLLLASAPTRAGDFRQRWAWSVPGDGIGLIGLEVVDLDGDGRREILATGDSSGSANHGYWYQFEIDGGLVQTWSSLPVEAGLRALRVGGSGTGRRIVVASANQLEVRDAATKAVLSTFPVATTDLRSLAVADLDGDGGLEAVVCSPSSLYVYELETGQERSARSGFGCLDLAIGQTDGDAELEIALAGNAAGGFVLDGVTLAVDWADVRGFGNRVRLGDLDGDGRDEVVSTVAHWRGVRVQDPETGGLLWESPLVEASAIQVGDLDPAPGLEVIYGVAQWGSLRVLRGSTGVQLWAVNNPQPGVSAIAVGEVDADGVPELLWTAGAWSSGSDYLYAADGATHAIEARTEDWRGPLVGFAVADMDADGDLELATASGASDSWYGPSILFELSFADGRLVRSAPQVWPGSFGVTASKVEAAQLDDDPAIELCAAGGYVGAGSVGCYDGETFAEQWRVALDRGAYTLAAGELDGSPYPELAVGTEAGFVYAIEGESGWLKWRTAEPPAPQNGFNRLEIGDLAGDGVPEVIASFGYPNLYDGSLTTFAAADGSRLAGPWPSPVSSMGWLPIPSSPGAQLLVGRADGQVVRVDPITGTSGNKVALLPERVNAFAVTDLDGDGVADVAAVGGGRLRVVDGVSGEVVWTSPFLGDSAGEDETLLVGDFDGDAVVELVVGTGVGVAVFEASSLAVFADGFESGLVAGWSATTP